MKTAAKRAMLIILSTTLFCISQIIFCGCGYTNPEEKTLCVCVTADSPTEGGKAVRSDVMTAIEYYLENVLSGADGYSAAYSRMRERISAVSALTSAVVRKRGGGYNAEVALTEKSRSSELIIKLGAGSGGSESREVYPKSDCVQDGIKYESLLVDIVNKFL